MDYQPITCVWEVTMGYNMRCKHWGSSCAEPLPGELTTAGATEVVDQMADIDLRRVTLSGGEPPRKGPVDTGESPSCRDIAPILL
jgi:MoaA/NifB/PqqE/SkfB family radical SAM enzyme